MNIDQFYKFIAENDPELCVDHQCHCLSEDGTPNFDAAVDNIERNFAFVGTTDRLSQDADEIRTELGFTFDPSIRINEAIRIVDLPLLPAATLDFLKSITRQDQKLYEFAKARWR